MSWHGVAFALSIVAAVGYAIYTYMREEPQYQYTRTDYRSRSQYVPPISEPITNSNTDSDSPVTRKRRSQAESDRCSICLSSLRTKNLLRKLTCGHEFHAHCLECWLNRNSSCPICREPIDE